MDMEILKRLSIHHTILSIRSFDIHNNGIFYLQIGDLHTKQIITQTKLGQVQKKGSLLNLTETHNLTCKIKHNNTYSHDPVTDKHYTKCLFHHINNIIKVPIKHTRTDTYYT